MLFPIIKVRDHGYQEKYEHVVGTNVHDMLLTDGKRITYYNLQNGEGTMGDYKFIGNEDEYYGVTIEFVTFEQLKEIYEKHIEEAK